MVYIVFAILILLAFLLYRNLYREARAKGKGVNFLYQSILYGFLIGVGVLILTGRVHWLGGAFALALLAIKKLIILAVRFWPLWLRILRSRGEQHKERATATHNTMTIARAYKVLELEPGVDKAQIVEAHRKMQAKLHPDKGGSSFLAAQVNVARDVLLKNLALFITNHFITHPSRVSSR